MTAIIEALHASGRYEERLDNQDREEVIALAPANCRKVAEVLERCIAFDEEITGLSKEPAVVKTPLLLSAVVVQKLPPIHCYARRIRELLAAGFSTGKIAGFEGGTLPIVGLPGWFSSLESPIPAEVAVGRIGFASQRSSDQLNIQE